MSFLKRILLSVITSVLVSLFIFIVCFSLMTGEFPPKLSHVKNLYFTFVQLKALNNEHQRNQTRSQNQSLDANLEEFSMYNKQVGAISNRLQVADAVDSLSQQPTYSTVADRVRAETEQRQKATQYLVQTQQLKDEIYKLKNENEILRRKITALIQRR